MSYTSHVVFVVKVNEETPKFEEGTDIRFFYVVEREGYKLYKVDCVKWYEEYYPTVKKVEEYIKNHLNECFFIRIGESPEDIKICGRDKGPFNFTIEM